MKTFTRIAVLYTGGTIGMLPSAQGLVPGTDFANRAHQALDTLPVHRRRQLPELDFIEYEVPIDSSNARPHHWQAIAEDIVRLYDQYDGFVVLHGTDTLAWTASSLAFQLVGLGKAVVVTGAQRPLEATDSDGLANLEQAVRFAALPMLKEVAVAFGGCLLRGCRTRKWDTHSEQGFSSPNWGVLGQWIEDFPVLYPSRLWLSQSAPAFELVSYSSVRDGAVVRLPLWPGINASTVERLIQAEGVRAVLLETWGSGNIPGDNALLGTLAEAINSGKHIVAISQCPHGSIDMGTYATGQILRDINVLPGDDMTPEAVFTKLVHLLAQDRDSDWQRQRFLMSVVGERSPVC
ncbi:asparaginase [Phytohalomonas tamaricis]|uniref:asparaginase n=1 Tax=Phytohalomonas tamaricis TaxID=2081032 RepID=UPI000D0B9DF2|nr:asparaginase [Phytohalomonas tamaricis]